MEDLVEFLERHGFVAAEEEAGELRARAAGDAELLSSMVERRLTGEPLAWITGTVEFCGTWIRVDPGVYVPRWQSELLAERALARLGPGRVAVDLCTGCGALAVILASSGARVVATDVHEASVACARANGVDAVVGDLFAPLPRSLAGSVDLVAGVVPYVPTSELSLLQRDTFTFETELAYDGGPDGCAILRRAIAGAAEFLAPGGTLMLELGGDEAELLRPDLASSGFADVAVLRDEDGDVRGVEATLAP
ncbi:Release factor glutamine methyltransferase [Baekduia alba]|uniref:N5-glutamine methyltransferase family protein n=1 Tax=Baekduia alba TaxID=2997333 RepID=UPI0023419869|nr:HemK/PrmC family methyltransferase [Baekduia alba]WCB96884.1 Release factor glutamine methyltransferase [Baekduia alba]